MTVARPGDYAMVAAFVDELVRCGVRNFSICPGSRSTPLALLIARHPDAQVWMHLDERSAAYFGLGLAKASGAPVALLCSSGTAAANFMPAVVEAHYARVPLVVLTADRPPELQESGSLQTIDQLKLFGNHAKWFVNLSVPAADPDLMRYARASASRAAATALEAPAGPVHVNWPFREPLVPNPAVDFSQLAREHGEPYAEVETGPRTLESGRIGKLADLLTGRRGVILCGPLNEPGAAPAIADLARRLRYPIVAEPLSGLRRGQHDLSLVMDAHELIMHSDLANLGLEPEVILRFGAFPTSKPLQQLLQRTAARVVVVDGGGGWNEPAHRVGQMIHANEGWLCAALTNEIAGPAPGGVSEFAERWQRANDVARRTLAESLDSIGELFEGKVLFELSRLLPDGALVYAGNSMPIRDLDTFCSASERSARFLANRGASGIDGVVSSALGAAAAGERVVLVIGDVSFYHDLNGLLAAKRHELDLTVVLLNNNGGGIFSFLQQASESDEASFELLFGTPHDLEFRPFVEAYGGRHQIIRTWDDFRQALRSALSTSGLDVIEVPSERGRNVVLHQEVWNHVAHALASASLSPASAEVTR